MATRGTQRWHDGWWKAFRSTQRPVFMLSGIANGNWPTLLLCVPLEELLRGRPLVEEDDEPMHPKRSWQKQAVSCVGGLLERVCVAFIVRSGAGAVAFRPWSPLIVAIHGSSHVCGHPFRSPTIPGAPLLAPAPSHASDFPLLPMRPST